jgi:hypothetical protein
MSDSNEVMLRSAESGKGKKGKSSLVKYLKGGRLTQRQAIQAKCYDCNGMGDSDECDIETCSLYPYSPYIQEKHLVEAPKEGVL